MTNRKYLIAIFIAILTTQPIIVAMHAHQQPVVVVQQDQSSLPARIGGAVGTALGTVLGWAGTAMGKMMWHPGDRPVNNLRRSTAMILLGLAGYKVYEAGKACDTHKKNGCWVCGWRGKKIKCMGAALLFGCSGLLMHPGIMP